MAGEPCVFHEGTEVKLEDHEKRLRCLEERNTRVLERVDNLCDKLEGLALSIKEIWDSLKKGIWFVATLGVGFIVWYIQQCK